MSDPSFFESIARDLTGPGMFGGKFQFRLILQPLAAIILGLRYGVRDAKAGTTPFLHSVATTKGGRGALLKGAARAAMIPLILAVLIDSILQQLINHRIRPGLVARASRRVATRAQVPLTVGSRSAKYGSREKNACVETPRRGKGGYTCGRHS